MARVFKRVRNGKVRWYADYADDRGDRRRPVFDRKIDAERHLTEVLHTLNTGSYIDPSRSKIKTGDFIDEKWLPTLSHLKAGTHAKYLGILDRHIRPRFGSTPLDRVTHADVAAWVNALRRPDQRPLAPGSIRYIHRVLYLVFELAVRDGRLPKNPAAGVKLPRLPRTEKRFLTRDEVFRLADAAAIYPIPEVGAQYKVLVLLLAHTGLRWSEAAGLKVECLDLMKRRLVVARTLGEVKGRLVWSSPKNHAQRQVPIPATLVDLLAELTAGKSPDDLVFTTWRGRPLRNLNWRRDCFDRAAEDAGLPGLTPHTLRHTAASLAVSTGANVKAVQRMLGHASATMTLDTYAGLFDADLDAVAERLDAGWRPEGARPNVAEVIRFPKRT